MLPPPDSPKEPTLSWISRHKLPVLLTAIVLVLASIAIVVVTLVVQPKRQQEADYATATKRLASAQKVNQSAHTAFDAAVKQASDLHDLMVDLPSAPAELFPAATLSKFTSDVKDLAQAMSTQAPTSITDLPKGDVTYAVATKALVRAVGGVKDNTDFTKQTTDAVLNTVSGVHSDLRDAAASVSDQAQSVLVANQGATDLAQTAFAASSDIDGNGDATAIVSALQAYVTAGKQVISENKEHPAAVEDDEPEATPSAAASASPSPTPTVTPTTPPSPSPSQAPTAEPKPQPVDHTPHVVANGQYVKSCSAPTTMFTQETGSGGTITINEDTPYTYETYETKTGFGVKVSACTAS